MNGQDFPNEICKDDMTTGVTKMDVQTLQVPCCDSLDKNVTEKVTVPLLSTVVNDYPNKKARIEKLEKKGCL